MVRHKLIEMNPHVSVEFASSLTERTSLSAVVASMSSFKETVQLNNQVRSLPSRPAFYGLNSSGLFGFAFIDFCDISYEVKKPGDQVEEKFEASSRSLADFLDGFF